MNNLAAIRTAAGITQQQLATAIGMSVRTVFAIERGGACRPPVKRAILLALGKDYTDLDQRHEVFPA